MECAALLIAARQAESPGHRHEVGSVRSPLIWKSGATEPIVGELLGTATNDVFDADILDINSAGFNVGYANADGSILSDLRATL